MSAKWRARKNSSRLLSNTRPTSSAKEKASSTLSSKASRKLIRSYHTLQKQLKQAEAEGDAVLAADIRSQIEAQGGLSKYQQASIQGQSSERGGDSSKVLVEWLRELIPDTFSGKPQKRFRLLEVGSLKIDNVIARCGIFDLTRIDLNSQHEQILQQDFMERPIPADTVALARDGFDMISLSLVLNYVSDPEGRGNMLRRLVSFLRQTDQSCSEAPFPGVFFVLPAPCITNSRYLDENTFEAMMSSLGYIAVRKKLSPKLAYYLFRLVPVPGQELTRSFAKKELRKAKHMNNFSIVL